MEPEVQDGQEVHETPEVVITPEEIAELKKQAEVSAQNFERAKKAEAKVKELSEKPIENNNALSPKDMLALSENSVSSADFDEVVRVASVLNKPIHEALQDPLMKTILQKNTEERRTAEATQTRASARGTQKVSGEDLLRRAESTGDVPDSDEGMRELAKARLGVK